MVFVTSVQKLEDCFDGSMIYQITLRRPIDEHFISYLGTKGDMDYYPDFPRPLFRLEIQGLCQLTGYLEATSFRAVIHRDNPRAKLALLREMLEAHGEGRAHGPGSDR